jgi:hypothetical protein
VLSARDNNLEYFNDIENLFYVDIKWSSISSFVFI